MSNKLYAGDTLTRLYTFTDQNNVAFNPDTITVTLTDPAETNQDTLSKTDLQETETGTFKLKWNIPTDATVGVWTVTVKATEAANGLVNSEEFYFRVYA